MTRKVQIAAILMFTALALRAEEPQAAPPGSQSRVYREGNSWVQEITGVMSPVRVIKIGTNAGEIRVTGAAQPNIDRKSVV